MGKKTASGRSDYGYGHEKINDITSVGANDEMEYLEIIHEGADKKTGSVPGKKSANNYGDSAGKDNAKYSERGTWNSDDKKLAAQAKADDRRYMYLQ